MENQMIGKINTLGKVGSILCKICKVVIIVGVIACLVGGILLCFVPREAARLDLTSRNAVTVHLDEKYDVLHLVDFDEGDGVLKLGNHTYQIVDDDNQELVVKRTFYVSDMKWLLFAGIIALAVLYLPFYYGDKLCSAFRTCATPFTQKISQGLRNPAWSLVPVAVVSSLAECVSDSLLSGDWDLSIGLDVSTVLLVLCIFMLSAIFKYGTALQTQSDETL